MKFNDVFDPLMEGKPISRNDWNGKFLYLDKEHNWFVYQVEEDCELITYSLDLRAEDLIADDWDIDYWDQDQKEIAE